MDISYVYPLATADIAAGAAAAAGEAAVLGQVEGGDTADNPVGSPVTGIHAAGILDDMRAGRAETSSFHTFPGSDRDEMALSPCSI